MIRTFVVLGVFAGTLFAQRSVPPEFMYHRVYAVVPLVGSGTPADPQRPMLVPAASQPGQTQAQPQATTRPDLLGWQMQVSDDGKFALVELVFQSPLAYQHFLAQAAAIPGSPTGAVALQPLSANFNSLAANTAVLKAAFEAAVPGMKLFERGKATQAEILAEFQKRKANFTFEGSSVRPQ